MSRRSQDTDDEESFETRRINQELQSSKTGTASPNTAETTLERMRSSYRILRPASIRNPVPSPIGSPTNDPLLNTSSPSASGLSTSLDSNRRIQSQNFFREDIKGLSKQRPASISFRLQAQETDPGHESVSMGDFTVDFDDDRPKRAKERPRSTSVSEKRNSSKRNSRRRAADLL